jgi:tRNA (uracil-5-)-methyltransferase
MSLYQPEGSDKKWAIIVPFAHPGDLIRVKVIFNHRLHSKADLLETLEYDDSLRGGEGDRRKNPEGGCKYFGIWWVISLTLIPEQILHLKRRYGNWRLAKSILQYLAFAC